MARELVPELHDIGKLVDNTALGAGFEDASHWFRGVDLAGLGLPLPATRSWLGITGHHLLHPPHDLSRPGGLPRELQAVAFEELAELFLVVLSDHFAASTSRTLRKRLEEEELGERPKEWSGLGSKGVHVLWTGADDGKGRELPIRDRGGLANLLAFLRGDPDREQFWERFGDELSWVAEEKGFPRNVTTLETHLTLVGKAYRVLRAHIEPVAGKRVLRYGRHEAVSVAGAERGWPFRLARCKITFPQRPARAHDLGVFVRLSELMGELEEGDHVLLRTLDTLWLFLPDEDLFPLRKALGSLLEAGLSAEVEVLGGTLGGLSPNVFQKRPEDVTRYYLQGEMPEQLSPGARLCVLCQERPALPAPDRDEESGIDEFLCQECFSIRRDTREKKRFSRLGGPWEQEDLPVAWVRIVLDYEHLTGTLKDLFTKRLKDSGLSATEVGRLEGELRDTALMVDFTKDYHQLLASFAGRLDGEFEDGVEEIGGKRPEVLAVALRQPGAAFKIADIFAQELARLFPLCRESTPMSLSISISNTKHPFFEHWRYLDAPREAVNFQVVGRTSLEVSIPRFEAIRRLGLEGERASSKLHRAAAVGTRTGSRVMEQMEFLEGIKKYPALHEASMQGFSVAELLSYHKIATIGGGL